MDAKTLELQRLLLAAGFDPGPLDGVMGARTRAAKAAFDARQGPRFLTIHAVGTPEGRHHKAAEINSWDRARFRQVSYHWIVELDGTRVRSLRDDQRGAHVGGHNSGNIGIAYVGGYAPDGRTPKDTRTPEQREALKALVQAYRIKYPRIVIRGHRDWSPDRDGDGVVERHEWLKACPCFDVADWLREIGLRR